MCIRESVSRTRFLPAVPGLIQLSSAVFRVPGMSTASWEVTGVLYRGGVIKLPRARSARFFCPPQARKFWRC